MKLKQGMHSRGLREKLDESVSFIKFTAGTAHDLNNALTIILGNIELAKMDSGASGAAYRVLGGAEKACLRARDLVRRLFAFSSRGAPVNETISMEGLIKSSAMLALHGSGVGCRFSIPKDLWDAEIDPGRITLAINNVVINAEQSVTKGSTIKVSAENAVLEQGHPFPLKNGKYVKITVKDTGIGIPGENLSRIFEPFFTTKHEGSGIGLNIASEIFKEHNGHITAESGPGMGASFHIYIPASEGKPETAAAQKKTILQGKGRVLLMDDEEEVLNTAALMLERIGYKVTSARDGKEAAETYRQAMESGSKFGVVIMDLIVPGRMGGREAIGEILKTDPGAKAIVSSGGSNDPVMVHYREYGFIGGIPKPYTITKLSRVLDSVIKEDKNELR